MKKRLLTVEEVDKLLSFIDTSTLSGKRDDALFELIYSCGLRISEACDLKISNVHLNEHLIMVHGKGDKERIVPFGERAEQKLVFYLNEVRPSLVNGKSVPEVFVNYKGERISRKGVWKRFHELEQLAGVNAKVHTLRHSFATHRIYQWYSAGKDIGSLLPGLSAYMGHSHYSHTLYYLHFIPELFSDMAGFDFEQFSGIIPEVDADD